MTEASRNFAECVNRVRYQGASFLLQKNGTPVARLVPVEFESAGEREVDVTDRDQGAEPSHHAARAAGEDPDGETLRDTPAARDRLNW